MITQVQQGTTAIRTFETLSRSDGARTAPSGLPTVVSAHVNGTVNSTLASGASVVQMQDATPANITGYYRLEFATASLAANDDIDITIQATISGTTVTQVLRFLVINRSDLLPVIR
jgi:hypothetical protein